MWMERVACGSGSSPGWDGAGTLPSDAASCDDRWPNQQETQQNTCQQQPAADIVKTRHIAHARTHSTCHGAALLIPMCVSLEARGRQGKIRLKVCDAPQGLLPWHTYRRRAAQTSSSLGAQLPCPQTRTDVHQQVPGCQVLDLQNIKAQRQFAAWT